MPRDLILRNITEPREWNFAICNNIDGARVYYPKQNKSERVALMNSETFCHTDGSMLGISIKRVDLWVDQSPGLQMAYSWKHGEQYMESRSKCGRW